MAAALAALAVGSPAPSPLGSTLVVWAWERAEDLRFARGRAEIAYHAAALRVVGARLNARGRRFLLLAAPGSVTTAVVHIEIDPARTLRWSPALADRTAAAALAYGLSRHPARLQIDFEARASERGAVTDVLRRVRAGLPPGTALSMTALASWCDTDRWLGRAPVDEIVPMLFRMGPDGTPLVARLANGGDFGEPRCRTALGISTDREIPRAPAGRHVYMFDPRPWTAASFARIEGEVRGWDRRAPGAGR